MNLSTLPGTRARLDASAGRSGVALPFSYVSAFDEDVEPQQRPRTIPRYRELLVSGSEVVHVDGVRILEV